MNCICLIILEYALKHKLEKNIFFTDCKIINVTLRLTQIIVLLFKNDDGKYLNSAIIIANQLLRKFN